MVKCTITNVTNAVALTLYLKATKQWNVILATNSDLNMFYMNKDRMLKILIKKLNKSTFSVKNSEIL